ncbi:Protein SYS1 -like protein [Halotydeus destructor]|nr:Protein SYS1 -like protein [Halotydeus destructor]
MTGQFRYTVWDPLLTASQVVTMQSFYYTSLGILIFVADCLYGQSPSLSHIFSYQDVSAKTGFGRFIIICYLINSLCGSFYLWNIVKRAKPCLDFSATVHIVHLVLSCLYNGSFPTAISWWILNIICVTIMCVCGEFLCMKREMKDIPLLGAKADV